MQDDQGDNFAAAHNPAPKLGFSSTPRPGMMAGNDGVCPTSRGRSAPEKRPTVPTSAVALREDATPPAPCRTRPHGRAEGIGPLLPRVPMLGSAALELAQAGSEGWQ